VQPTNGAAGIWQLHAQSWLLEEEDRERVAQHGLAVIRERDRQEYEVAEAYFGMRPAEMKVAAAEWRRWGYGPERLWNPPEIDHSIAFGNRLERLWLETLEEPGSDDALLRWVRQSGSALSSICSKDAGFEFPVIRSALWRGDFGVAEPLRTVLFNDTTKALLGEPLAEERAQWFFNQGVLPIVMRWLRGGLELLLQQNEGLALEQKPEGWPERVARAALWDPHQTGRFLRGLIEEALLNGVLEIGLPALTSQSGVGAGFGDWILAPWWQLAQNAGAGGGKVHQLCAMARRMAWPEGQHPMVRFELTADDLELIQAWVLQHRCRLATGRWEFSPAWSFIPVIEQIFWLHGLIADEDRGYLEHNGTAAGYSFIVTPDQGHVADRDERWVPNDPKANELDWRIRELILPVVEELAAEVAELYGGHSELNEKGKRWAAVFYPWEKDPAGYEASQHVQAEMVEIAREWLNERGVQAGEGSKEIGEQMAEELEELLQLEGVKYWLAAQGWTEALGVNELLVG